MSTNATRMKAVLLALGIFVLGAALGATYQRWLPPGKDQRRSDRLERRGRPPFGASAERLLNRYVRNLELNDEQRAEIEGILDEGRVTMGNMRREIRAKTETVTRKTWARIRDILTPDQQERFDELTSPVSPAIILQQLTRDLDLDEERQATVRRILKKNWATMQELRRKTRKQLRTRLENTREKMNAVLTPGQSKQIESLKPFNYRGFHRRLDLDLSEEQRTRIERIEKNGRAATRRIFQERDEQLGSLTGKTWSEIKALLRKDQLGKFEKITRGIERRMGWKRQLRRRSVGRALDF